MDKKTIKRFIVAPLVGVVIVMIYMLIVGGAFKNPTPKDLPIALIAPAPQAQMITTALEAKAPGVFDVSTYDDVDSAKTAMKQEKILGIIQVQPQGITVVTAGANGEATGTVIEKAAEAIAANQKLSVQTQDLTPSVGLTTGIITMFLILLTTVAAIATQVMIIDTKTKTKFGVWFGATVVTAICIGLAAAGSAAILDVYREAFWQVSCVLALMVLVAGSLTALCIELLGKEGASISAIILIPFGVATAGVLFDYRFLPAFYEHIAHYLPAANAVALMRQFAYFDSMRIAQPIFVLITWLVVCVALLAAVYAYKQRRIPTAAKKNR